MRRSLTPVLLAVLLALGGGLALAAAAQDDRKADDKQKTTIVKGRVVEMQADKNRFTLRSLDGRQMTFSVDESAKLSDRESKAKLGDFKKGRRVLVVYAKGDGETHRVVEMMPSYASADDVVKEFRQAFRTVESYAYGEKEEFERILTGLTAEARDLISDLASEAQREGSQFREEYVETRKELLKKAEAIEKRLGKAAAAGADEWDDLKKELRESLDDFEKAYEKARSRFDREDK